MSEDKFDVIIVGGGPAGLAAAFVLAKAGKQVIVLERGEYCGSKNVFGGILFTGILEKLIPDYLKDAPLERNVTRRGFSLLTPTGELGGGFKFDKFNTAPFNNSFTTLRAKFDNWFAGKAEEAGAMIITGATVDDFLYDTDGKIKGVKARMDDGDILGDVVILADGVNSLLAKKIKLHKELDPKYTIVAVKEIIQLTEEKVADRFHLNGNEGAALEYFGCAAKGAVGAGFVYTNKDTISIGLGASIKSLMEHKLNPNDALEYFKNHPAIAPLIRGGEQREYSAHLIPDGGYDHISKLFTDNVLVAGDAAGFVNNTLFHEGTNLAMQSGVSAAETVIEAGTRKDFSAASLSVYNTKLEESFVLRDVKHFRKTTDALDANPQLFEKYPKMLEELVSELFTPDGEPKWDKEMKLMGKLLKQESPWGLIKTALAMRRVII